MAQKEAKDQQKDKLCGQNSEKHMSILRLILLPAIVFVVFILFTLIVIAIKWCKSP